MERVVFELADGTEKFTEVAATPGSSGPPAVLVHDGHRYRRRGRSSTSEPWSYRRMKAYRAREDESTEEWVDRAARKVEDCRRELNRVRLVQQTGAASSHQVNLNNAAHRNAANDLEVAMSEHQEALAVMAAEGSR